MKEKRKGKLQTPQSFLRRHWLMLVLIIGFAILYWQSIRASAPYSFPIIYPLLIHETLVFGLICLGLGLGNLLIVFLLNRKENRQDNNIFYLASRWLAVGLMLIAAIIFYHSPIAVLGDGLAHEDGVTVGGQRYQLTSNTTFLPRRGFGDGLCDPCYYYDLLLFRCDESGWICSQTYEQTALFDAVFPEWALFPDPDNNAILILKDGEKIYTYHVESGD